MQETLTSEKIPRIDADTPWKNILDAYFLEFMEYCLPAVAINIEANIKTLLNWEEKIASANTIEDIFEK